jgi:hypothetical protein
MLPMQPYYLPSSPNVPLPSPVASAQGLAQISMGAAG